MNETYKRLVKSLQLIALPFEKQTKVLPEFVCLPDEIALIFDDMYRLVLDGDNTEFSTNTKKNLKLLDTLFEEMSKNKSLWTLSSLENSRDWEKSRDIAKLVLNELREPVSMPELDFLNFVEGQ